MSCVLIDTNNYIADIEDPFNTEKTRDYENTDTAEYNCMGFALLNFAWMHPLFSHCDWEHFCDDCREDEADESQDLATLNIEINCETDGEREYAEEEVYYCHQFVHRIAMKLAIENMLAHFKGLRRIDSFDELKDGEYGIAYATGDYDFHFVTYFPKYGYYSKQGKWDVEKNNSLEEGFDDRYYSERVLFARPIPSNLSMEFLNC
jgi:hypothetical protein